MTCGKRPAEEEFKSGEEPSTLTLETLAVEPVCRHKIGEMYGASEESWHDANEYGWEMACEEVEDEAVAEKEEMRTGAEGSGIGSRPDWASN